jgi:hypothetical protein
MSTFIGTRKEPKGEVVPLTAAVFCLDCEVISTSRGDECAACHGHSLLNLGRILGGSLHDRKSPGEAQTGLFDITLTVSVQQMHANDVNTTLEGLTRVIGPRLAEGRASFHIDVQPRADTSRKAA